MVEPHQDSFLRNPVFAYKDSTGAHYTCDCILCGGKATLRVDHLTKGNQRSCGCLVSYKPKAKDLTGMEMSGNLIVGYMTSGVYKVLHTCGHYSEVQINTLKHKRTSLCNTCSKVWVAKGRATHGMSGNSNKTYSSWLNMRKRCYEPTNNRFEHYGGKGINVCDRWKNSFENFLEDMGERPEGKTLDRINLDKDYCPENCKWSNAIQQANNKSNNLLIEETSTGVTYSLKRWCEILGLEYRSKFARYRYLGKPIEDVLGEGYIVVQDNYKSS
jgi:hypothetical protein